MEQLSGKKQNFINKLQWKSIALVLSLIGWLGTIGYYSFNSYSHYNPEFCGSCHIMTSYVKSYLSSNHMSNVHYMASVMCQDCHTEYTIFEKAKSLFKYVTGNYERVLSRRKFEDDMCLKCHISMEHQAIRTDFLVKNPHLSHWPELRCMSCHLAHDKQVDYCSRCHDNGGQRMTGEPIVPRARNPWADPNAQFPTIP